MGSRTFSSAHSAPNGQGEECLQDSVTVVEDLPASATIRQQGDNTDKHKTLIVHTPEANTS